jgi:hypothetical protein
MAMHRDLATGLLHARFDQRVPEAGEKSFALGCAFAASEAAAIRAAP